MVMLTLLCARALISAACRMTSCSYLLLIERRRSTSGAKGLGFKLSSESKSLSCFVCNMPPEGDKHYTMQPLRYG